MHRENRVEVRFMELDGHVSEISGNEGAIAFAQRNQWDESRDK